MQNNLSGVLKSQKSSYFQGYHNKYAQISQKQHEECNHNDNSLGETLTVIVMIADEFILIKHDLDSTKTGTCSNVESPQCHLIVNAVV
ncbi:hypothetical protein FGO68_gene9390 [Halteria grandinella]|uniref:Uncharacterized protein n=1 Tax=Halteria grandinella TaxID=5974 RepID=A0A8J8NL73_HALGN|nr:hypothetical protein FGO68_gene9390 [Halteria grandinella]